MCYVCGKSSNKIIHSTACRYVKMIPKKNKKFFETLKDAFDAGYTPCKYCARINILLREEKAALETFCRSNGIFFHFNTTDGSLDVISRSGKWKIIVNGKKEFIWLYHQNRNGVKKDDLVPGYHSQKVRCGTLMGYMNYIVKHDKFREDNPLYGNQKYPNAVKGSKKWRKDKRRADKARKTQNIYYVKNLIEELAAGKAAY